MAAKRKIELHWSFYREANARVGEMNGEVLFLKDTKRRLKDELNRIQERIALVERNIEAVKASVRT